MVASSSRCARTLRRPADRHGCPSPAAAWHRISLPLLLLRPALNPFALLLHLAAGRSSRAAVASGHRIPGSSLLCRTSPPLAFSSLCFCSSLRIASGRPDRARHARFCCCIRLPPWFFNL